MQYSLNLTDAQLVQHKKLNGFMIFTIITQKSSARSPEASSVTARAPDNLRF